MLSGRLSHTSLAVLAAAASLAVSAPAAAQFIQAVPDANSPVTRLSSYIRILAGSPRNFDALIGAGRAALDVGDANAALGFFSRAEEIAPTSGRAKAGLGAALANIEKPEDALRLFAQGAALGAPEAEFARDRGLAHDLTGDWRRAQRDYQIALRTNAGDDETVRRYALSLGISGDRAGALRMLDPLLRRQDQGAWRARSFIYAMTGDVAQANAVARQLMPAPMAAAVSPLLTRLATLNPAERAHAVNFGTVPAAGTRLASADTSRALPPSPYAAQRAPTLAEAIAERQPDRSPSSGLIPAGEPLGRRVPPPAAVTDRPIQLAVRQPLPVPVPVPVPVPRQVEGAAQPQRRFVDGDPLAAASVRRIGPRIGPVDPARLPPEARGAPATVTLLPATALPPTPDRGRLGGGATAADAARLVPLDPTALTAPNAAAPLPIIEPTRVVAPPTTILPSSLGAGAVGQTAFAGPPIGPPAAPSAAAAVSVARSPVIDTPAPGFTQPVTPVQIATAQATPVQATPVRPKTVPPAEVIAPPPRPAVPPPGMRLAGLLSGIATEAETTVAELPSARELRLARAATKRRAAEAAAKVEEERLAKAAAATAAAQARRNPARLWVQVATGANERGLPLTWRRVRGDNQAALKGLAAYSVPYKATNRLLVGPVASAAAARDIVRALGKNGLTATTYSSEAGQEVAQVAAK